MYVLSNKLPDGGVVTLRLTTENPEGSEFLTILEALAQHGGALLIYLHDGRVYNCDFPACWKWLQ